MLGHLITLQEEKEAEVKKESYQYWMNYMAMVRARTPQTKKEAEEQQRFAESIRPKEDGADAPPLMEFDPEKLKRLAAAQT